MKESTQSSILHFGKALLRSVVGSVLLFKGAAAIGDEWLGGLEFGSGPVAVFTKQTDRARPEAQAAVPASHGLFFSGAGHLALSSAFWGVAEGNLMGLNFPGTLSGKTIRPSVPLLASFFLGVQSGAVGRGLLAWSAGIRGTREIFLRALSADALEWQGLFVPALEFRALCTVLAQPELQIQVKPSLSFALSHRNDVASLRNGFGLGIESNVYWRREQSSAMVGSVFMRYRRRNADLVMLDWYEIGVSLGWLWQRLEPAPESRESQDSSDAS